MKKWEVARYLIDAKKCVDSIWYIAENAKIISNINLRKKVSEILREFYINCCVVLDETHNKKTLCQENTTINRIYYERDKDKAHKGSDYTPIHFSTLFELRDCMKEQILTVRKHCHEVLPDVVTLDFVPHDKELFRLVHSITAEKEEEIKKAKYPRYKSNTPEPNTPHTVLKIFRDTEDIRNIPLEQRSEYGVLIENGINIFEGLQERQDSIIRLNVLYGHDLWCQISKEHIEWLIRITELGLLDIFSMPKLPDPDNAEAVAEFQKMMYGAYDYEPN